MELYKEKNGEPKGRIVNCVNMIDISNKRKMPMQTQDQVNYLRQIILDYNGDAPAYQNIETVMIDAGSGGAGKNIADLLMEDWIDSKGKKHPGLIDKELDKELNTGYSRKFPSAIDKVRLIEPSKYKSMMYEAAIEMTNNNLISFTTDYDNKGYLTLFEADDAETMKAKKSIEERLKKQNLSEEEYAFQLKEELRKSSSVKTKVVKLDAYQEIALANIDALKEELVNMIRKKRDSGKDSFELIPEKANKLHDDRAYTFVMASFYLSNQRMSRIRNKAPQSSANIINKIQMTKAKQLDRKFG
jgi:hypothetical protein